jgi:hypothetical protein
VAGDADDGMSDSSSSERVLLRDKRVKVGLDGTVD